MKALYFIAFALYAAGGAAALIRFLGKGGETARKVEAGFLSAGVLTHASIAAVSGAETSYVAVCLLTAAASMPLVLRAVLSEKLQKLGAWGAGFSLVAITVYLIYMWNALARPPFQFLSETFVLMSWSVALLFLISESLQGLKGLGQFSGVLMVAFIVFDAVWPDMRTKELPPALQSGWFVPHVLVYLLGYGALTLAFVAAAAHLFAERYNDPRSAVFGDVSYKLVSLGFPFLTAGLVFGAFWGQAAWGTWWGWDPKENWALVTWLVYVIYLHMRHLKGWNRSRAAWVLIAGVAAIFITYLVVSYLPTAKDSVHTYQG